MRKLSFLEESLWDWTPTKFACLVLILLLSQSSDLLEKTTLYCTQASFKYPLEKCLPSVSLVDIKESPSQPVRFITCTEISIRPQTIHRPLGWNKLKQALSISFSYYAGEASSGTLRQIWKWKSKFFWLQIPNSFISAYQNEWAKSGWRHFHS